MKPLSSMDREMERLVAECDERERQYKDAHKNDPCSLCGSRLRVEVIAYGSVAKLTPLCGRCQEKSRIETNAYHRGFYDGVQSGRKRHESIGTRLGLALRAWMIRRGLIKGPLVYPKDGGVVPSTARCAESDGGKWVR